MHYFESEDYLHGENLRPFDRTMTALVHYFSLGGVAFEEPGVQVLSWVDVLLVQGLKHRSGIFFLSFPFTF
jgi:hypothetical protein